MTLGTSRSNRYFPNTLAVPFIAQLGLQQIRLRGESMSRTGRYASCTLQRRFPYSLAGSPLRRAFSPAGLTTAKNPTWIIAEVVLLGITLPILSVDSNGGATLETFAYQAKKTGYTECKQGFRRLGGCFRRRKRPSKRTETRFEDAGLLHGDTVERVGAGHRSFRVRDH